MSFKVGDRVRVKGSAFVTARSGRIAKLQTFHSGMPGYVLEDGGWFDDHELEPDAPRRNREFLCRLFTRLTEPSYWQRMARQGTPIQCGTLASENRLPPEHKILRWYGWVLDGKAYLFRDDRPFCLRCDWFDFCHALRAFGLR